MNRAKWKVAALGAGLLEVIGETQNPPRINSQKNVTAMSKMVGAAKSAPARLNADYRVSYRAVKNPVAFACG
jgi:hypothetical protein